MTATQLCIKPLHYEVYKNTVRSSLYMSLIYYLTVDAGMCMVTQFSHTSEDCSIAVICYMHHNCIHVLMHALVTVNIDDMV